MPMSQPWAAFEALVEMISGHLLTLICDMITRIDPYKIFVPLNTYGFT